MEKVFKNARASAVKTNWQQSGVWEEMQSVHACLLDCWLRQCAAVVYPLMVVSSRLFLHLIDILLF